MIPSLATSEGHHTQVLAQAFTSPSCQYLDLHQNSRASIHHPHYTRHPHEDRPHTNVGPSTHVAPYQGISSSGGSCTWRWERRSRASSTCFRRGSHLCHLLRRVRGPFNLRDETSPATIASSWAAILRDHMLQIVNYFLPPGGSILVEAGDSWRRH
jgi:hypothetical protein